MQNEIDLLSFTADSQKSIDIIVEESSTSYSIPGTGTHVESNELFSIAKVEGFSTLGEKHAFTPNAIKPSPTWRPVSNAECSKTPYNAVGWLAVYYPDPTPENPKKMLRVISTGALVGPRLVLTAAHNIFKPEFGGFASAMQFVPGMYDGNSAYGMYKVVKAYRDPRWNGTVINVDYDFALVLLERPVLNVRSFGTASFDDKTFQALSLQVAGYPIVTGTPPSPNVLQDPEGKRMWTDTGGKITRTAALQFDHTSDIWIGQSGGPLWTMLNGAPYVVGVQSAHSPSNAPKINHGCRITKDRVDIIKDWMQRYP